MKEKRTFTTYLALVIFYFSLSGMMNPTLAQDSFSVCNVGHFGGYAGCATVSDNYAFLCQGTVLTVLDVTGDDFTKIASLTLPAEPDQCLLHNNHLYLFQWSDSLRVVDVNNAAKPEIVASLHLHDPDGWGTGQINADGNYLYITMQDSFKIVDISNPALPSVVNTVVTAANNIFVQNNFAYVVSDEQFKIFDISDVLNPVSKGSIETPQIAAIFVQDSTAYLGLDDYPDIGLQLVDVADPDNPEKLGFLATKHVEGTVTAYKSPEKLSVQGNYAYVGCRGADAWLHIVDVSAPDTPTDAGTLEFAEGAFPAFQSLDVVHSNLYAATGASSTGFIQINISDPMSPEIEKRYREPWDVNSLATSGDLLYVSSFDQLWVYDYADTSNPVLLGADTTWAALHRMQVENNYLFGAKDNQLIILDVNDPTNIFEVGSIESSNETILEFNVLGDFAYLLTVSENQSLLEIVNIADPNQPVKVTGGELVIPGSGRDLCLTPDSLFALVAYNVDEADHGFQIIDISNPSELSVKGSAQTTANPIEVGVTDTLAILGSNTDDNWFLETFNIKDPAHPVNLGGIDGSQFGQHTAVSPNPFSRTARLLKHNNKSVLNSDINNQAPNSPTSEPNNIVDFKIIAGFNSGFKDFHSSMVVVSIPGGSLEFFFLKPGTNGSRDWVLQAICHSPASAFIARMVYPNFLTFFSIDGWFNPASKQVSGSWGVFVQRLIKKLLVKALEISPKEVTVNKGDEVQFSAKGFDANGNEAATSVKWKASGGEIDSNGKFTATESGDFTITGTDSASGVSATATVHVNPTGISSQDAIPTDFSLSQNYPNPFNPQTTIEFGVKERSQVRLEVYDINGRLTATPANGIFQPGFHKVDFNAQNLPSGVYFFKIRMKDFTAVRKMVLLQ